MVVRKYVDRATGESLIFPDQITLSDWKSANHGDKATISAYVTLGVSATALAQTPRSRPIIMTDLMFSLEGPNDKRVLSFDFVRDKEATGTFVLVTSVQYVDAIKVLVTTNSDYLKPGFKGVSEEFVDEVEIGTATLQAASVQQVNKLVGVARTLSAILDALITHSDTLRSELADQIINTYGAITRAADGGSFILRLQEGRALSARLTAIQPRVESISGDSQTLGVEYVA